MRHTLWPLSGIPPQRWLGLAMALLLAGCLQPSPEKLNKLIDKGSSARALERIAAALESDPQNPALNLLAAKALLAQCAKTNCPSTNPAMLNPLKGYLVAATEPLVIEEGPTLTSASVVNSQLPALVELEAQPASLLTAYEALPESLRSHAINAMFQPALNSARAGHGAQAATYLTRLSKEKRLPPTITTFALALANLFENNTQGAQDQLLALRALSGEIPPAGGSLVPWALLTQAQKSEQKTPARQTLENLPAILKEWQLENVISEATRSGLTQELNTIGSTAPLRASWEKSAGVTGNQLELLFQQLSLSLNPDQPELWGNYLPSLVQAVASGTTTLSGGLMVAVSPTHMGKETQQTLITQLLQAGTRLQQQPAVALPLVMLAGNLSPDNAQKVELEKLTQSLLLKASSQNDVSTTLQLVAFKPEIALNNRQTVMPPLVNAIRAALRNGQFTEAVAIAELLQTKMEMDVQLDPLLLQEFGDHIKRDNIEQDLRAETPEVLMQPREDVALDLGPMFTFMQSHFSGQPKILTAQLTTLIANAGGTYGPASAMHRLFHLFPEDVLTPENRTEWLNQAITEALLRDKTLPAETMAADTVKLIAQHPQLNPAPILDEALKRASTLEEYRGIWKASPTPLREVLGAIRPQYVALMRSVDALDSGHPSAAVKEMESLTEPEWITQAKPFTEQFHRRLADIAGTYVPASGVASLNTGAIILAPAGLKGGKLAQVSVTFVSRMGTRPQNDPQTLTSTPAGVQQLTLAVPLDFDTGTLDLSSASGKARGETFNTTFGAIQWLRLEAPGKRAPGTAPILMVKTGADRSALPFTRTLASPDLPLRPDGTYLITTAIAEGSIGTEAILPSGTVLMLHTGSSWQPAAADSGLPGPVHPLTGTLHHPAGSGPVYIEGTFNPATLTSDFIFSYPLPISGQPVKAAVRCQALAGPIMCGSHFTHSARKRFAALSAGMQTRESLTQSASERAAENARLRNALLEEAQKAPPETPVAPSPTLQLALAPSTPTSSPTLKPEPSSNTTPSPTAPISATATIPTATPTPSPTASPVVAAPTPTIPSPTQASAKEEEVSPAEPADEDAGPEPLPLETATAQPSPSTAVSATETSPTKAPKTIVLAPGEKLSGTVAPGTFIHRPRVKLAPDESNAPPPAAPKP